MKRALWAGALLLAAGAAPALAQAAGAPVLTVDLGGARPDQVSLAMRILLGLTVLSLAPAILVSMTAFVRIIIVLSMLRHALGTQETPPNTVLISLALFLTAFTMMPVLETVQRDALTPYMDGRLSNAEALERGMAPVRQFMLRQTREKDLALMIELSRRPVPPSAEAVPTPVLVPAFMLSELRAAFQIGFVVFLPFLLIDLIVSTVLMSLGMMMVPPVSIALPLKLLVFVLIDGWNLVVRALLATFH